MKKTPVILIIAALCFTSGVYAQSHLYTVKKGDTLYSISKKFNIRLESLKDVNKISDPLKLFPGMDIIIPGGYTVEKGDTLYSIAKKYNTTVDELSALNDMDKNSILFQGQFLHVPVVEGVQTGQVAEEKEEDKESEETDFEITGDFEWPHSGERSNLTGKLKGIQIIGAPGDNIVSVAGGRVVWASEYGIYKKLVLIESSNGIVYGYGGNEKNKCSCRRLCCPGKYNRCIRRK